MQQPAWGHSREFEITTRSVGRGGLNFATAGDLEDDEGDGDALVHGRRKRKVAFMPSFGKLFRACSAPVSRVLMKSGFQIRPIQFTITGTGSGCVFSVIENCGSMAL